MRRAPSPVPVSGPGVVPAAIGFLTRQRRRGLAGGDELVEGDAERFGEGGDGEQGRGGDAAGLDLADGLGRQPGRGGDIARDGWALHTIDGGRAAHIEHTVRLPRTGRACSPPCDRPGDQVNGRGEGSGILVAMEQRTLGRTGRQVGVVGLGTWQLGADWGDVDEEEALATLDAAVDAGVTFFDTADVYGDGRSEQIVGRLAQGAARRLTVATKMGRRVAAGAVGVHPGQLPRLERPVARRTWASTRIDLVQLHCPPTPVYSTDAVFDALDTLVEEGRIAAYGVSVETCEEALTAIARPGVATRADHPQRVPAQAAGAGAARGRRGRGGHHRARPARQRPAVRPVRRARPRFAADDHRTFNRHGEAFDVGETFSGVDFDTGLEAVGAAGRRSCRRG